MVDILVFDKPVALDCPTGLFLFGFQRMIVFGGRFLSTSASDPTMGFSAAGTTPRTTDATTMTKTNAFATPLVETGGGRTGKDAFVLICISGQRGG